MEYSRIVVMGDFDSRVAKPVLTSCDNVVYEYSGTKEFTLTLSLFNK